MHQMIYEFTQIEHLVGVNRTRYNQYESMMLPLINYLKDQGCTFVLNRRVTDWHFKDTPLQDEITVTGLVMTNTETGEEETVDVDEQTAVIFTNGPSPIQQPWVTTIRQSLKTWITGPHPVCGRKPRNTSTTWVTPTSSLPTETPASGAVSH